MAIKAKANERELLGRVAAGDEQAFAELFQAYYHPLADYIFRLTEELHIAEEVVQDTFVKLWLRRADLHQVRHLADYLFILSRNQALNYLRQKARERVRQQEWLKAIASEAQSDTSEDLSGPYRDLLERAVQQLPPRQQQVYTMVKRQHMKYEEVARTLNLSVETVRKHMKLALKSVRTYAARHIEAPILLILLGPAVLGSAGW